MHLQTARMAGLGAENHGFVQVVMSQADSQFELASQPAHPSGQFDLERAICNFNFNQPVEVASAISEQFSASQQAEFWAAAAGAWVKV